MLDELTVIFHPAFWVIVVVMVIGAGVYGFGSTVAEKMFPPSAEEIREEQRQQCVALAHTEKESCLNGGVLNGIFKTKGRVKACDEIYQREVKACG